MKHSKKFYKMTCIAVALLTLMLCSFPVFAAQEPETAPAAGPAVQTEAEPALDAAAQAAQQQAIEEILKPASMMPIFLWSIAAALIMCAPVALLVAIKRRHSGK